MCRKKNVPTPGRCSESSSSTTGLRVLQLLSGREHSSSGSRLAEVAKSMMNYQYLVGDAASDEVAVIDGCWDPAGIAAFAKSKGLKIVKYIATHYHYDHIGGEMPGSQGRIPGLREFVDDMGLVAHIHKVERDHAIRSTGVVHSNRVVGMKQGSRIELGKVSLRFLHTPGHSPGGMSIVLSHGGVEEAIITGDTLFPGSCGRVDLPGSDKADMFRSIQGVLAKQPDRLVVWPGHGYSTPSSTIGQEKLGGLLKPMSMDQWMAMMG